MFLVSLLCLGYQIAYSQLAFAGKKEHDPIGNLIPDIKGNLAKSLGKLSLENPGKVSLIFNVLLTGSEFVLFTFVGGGVVETQEA